MNNKKESSAGQASLLGQGVGHVAGLMALRVFGLVSVLPVFALYAATLPGAQTKWVGIALGIYGLSQALCQMPLAIASDHWGRSNIVAGGFLVLALGSVVCAVSQSVWGLIIGRFLQGAGAIGSTLMAGLADVTLPATRTRAMALLGATLGVTFSASMVLGPVMVAHMGVRGLFMMTAVMAVAAAVWAKTGFARCLVHRTEAVAGGDAATVMPDEERGWRSVRLALARLLRDPYALGLNMQIGLLHLVFVGNMAVIPLLLHRHFHIATAGMWRVYLPVLCAAFLFMLVGIGWIERRKRAGVGNMAVSIAVVWCGLVLAQGLLAVAVLRAGGVLLALISFFTFFSLLEALLPSSASQHCPVTQRGVTMGMFSSFQYFGMFLGGSVAGGVQGWLQGGGGALAVLLVNGGVCLFCCGIALYTSMYAMRTSLSSASVV